MLHPTSTPPVSARTLTIELFPPARPEGIEGLVETVRRLLPLEPEFFSVTYGAGGSTRERSLSTVRRVGRETDGCIAAHLTCVACTARETDAIVETFLDMGVRRFFALRGDVPGAGVHPGSYPDALSLVRALARRGVEEIHVAAYPEVHPKASSAAHDRDVLKAKIEAGAKGAVTQFFLDNAAFYRFRDRLAAEGCHAPLVPGLLLFEDFARAAVFADRCGTRIPAAVRERFVRFEGDPVAGRRAALEFQAEQLADLRRNGVERFHLYALNRCEAALALFGAEARAAPLTAAA